MYGKEVTSGVGQVVVEWGLWGTVNHRLSPLVLDELLQ